ncbi:MAG TPA: hypothetical protein VFI91_01620 [Longimicrobiaceae bacterium]|nr:hypothetical protein [Longimicrobiaceae bacterium]
MRRLTQATMSAALTLFLATCSSRPEYPVTQHAVPFSEINARLAGSAPPVAADVNRTALHSRSGAVCDLHIERN